MCSSLAHCFIVVNFNSYSIHRSPPLEFAKVISKKKPILKRSLSKGHKKEAVGSFFEVLRYRTAVLKFLFEDISPVLNFEHYIVCLLFVVVRPSLSTKTRTVTRQLGVVFHVTE